MGEIDEIWKTSEQTENYLKGTRGAIPLAEEQINTILRIVMKGRPEIGTFLDLGCGDGVLGRAVFSHYHSATGIFADFSEPMLKAALEALENSSYDNKVVKIDYGDPGWIDEVLQWAPFDLVVSGFSIHHQSDERKRAVFEEVYNLLAPGGLFLNLEHVASPTRWIEEAFEDLFIDSLLKFNRESGETKSREELKTTWLNRRDKEINILAPVERQVEWLREIGYSDTDCYFKIFELALFGGRKPDV